MSRLESLPRAVVSSVVVAARSCARSLPLTGLLFARRQTPHAIQSASRLIVILTAAIAIFSAPPPLLAADPALPTIDKIRVGFAGKYKQGCWTPVRITVHGGTQAASGRLSLIVPDSDGVDTEVFGDPDRMQLFPAAQDTTVMLYAKVGNAMPPFTIRLAIAGQRTIEATFDAGAGQGNPDPALDATRPLVLTIGGQAGLDERTDSQVPEDVRPLVAGITNIEELPTRWYGYDGVESLVLLTSHPDIYRSLGTDSDQLDAIRAWLERGGRVVLCVGQSAEEALAAGGPLAELAPGRLAGRVPVRQGAALETFSDTGERLEWQGALEVPRLVDLTGSVEAYEGNSPKDLPLVVRGAARVWRSGLSGG